jgi:uncharacterized protein YukE
MPVYDPNAFVRALKAMAEGDQSPYLRLLAARNHMETAELPLLALGIAGSFFVGDEYEMSRRFFHSNLEWGAENFYQVLKGLQQIGLNYNAVEQANVILPDKVVEPPLPELSLSWDDLDGGAQLLVLAAGWTLAIRAMMIATVLKGCAKFSITAILSTVLWALFMPMDTNLTEVHSKWESAAGELAQFNIALTGVMTQFGRAWDGPAADAFTGYVTKLQQELTEGQFLLQRGAGTLQSLHEHLNFRQHLWFTFTLAILVLFVTLAAIGSAFPPAAGPAKVMMEFVGGMLSKTVSSWIAIIGETCKAVFFGVVPMETKQFVSEKQPWKHGGVQYDGLDLKDVRLTPDAIMTLFGNEKPPPKKTTPPPPKKKSTPPPTKKSSPPPTRKSTPPAPPTPPTTTPEPPPPTSTTPPPEPTPTPTPPEPSPTPTPSEPTPTPPEPTPTPTGTT